MTWDQTLKLIVCFTTAPAEIIHVAKEAQVGRVRQKTEPVPSDSSKPESPDAPSRPFVPLLRDLRPKAVRARTDPPFAVSSSPSHVTCQVVELLGLEG